MNVVAFIVSFGLFVGGLYMMGSAFQVAEGWHLPFFLGGILVTTIGIMLPIHVFKRLDA